MTHVQIDQDLTTAYCGEMLNGEFYFRDANAAIHNALFGTKRLCRGCAEKIIKIIEDTQNATSATPETYS